MKSGDTDRANVARKEQSVFRDNESTSSMLTLVLWRQALDNDKSPSDDCDIPGVRFAPSGLHWLQNLFLIIFFCEGIYGATVPSL